MSAQKREKEKIELELRIANELEKNEKLELELTQIKNSRSWRIITKLRKIEDATQPTVDDLIAISNYFGVTIDELIRPQEKNEQEQFENMGQIIQTLFSLDKVTTTVNIPS